jgi:hypothetical protein
VQAAQPLAAANPEEPQLDYTSPVTLKYFGLWLWATDRAAEGDTRADGQFTAGPLDWGKYFEPDLLSLPAFNCHA